jgi:hypothetical protein
MHGYSGVRVVQSSFFCVDYCFSYGPLFSVFRFASSDHPLYFQTFFLVEGNHLPIKLVPYGYIFFYEFTISFPDTKCLKIPKGQSEAVNRRTDNTMAKRKRRKR